MRIASNKLHDLIGFYQSELSGVYGISETEALTGIAVEHYLGYSRAELTGKLNSNINQSDLIKLYDCCKDLRQQIPLQYILGEAWFYGAKFSVNKNVLIPRPETEELVDIIIKENKTNFSCLDIGTGSGCIAITIQKNSTNSFVAACDISKPALDTAGANATKNKADVSFFLCDILNAEHAAFPGPAAFNVIVSNPPYIQSSEKESMEDHVLSHEPHLALFAEGDDAIIFYKKIINLCIDKLSAGGILYFELNPLTAQDVKNYAVASGIFSKVVLINDMSNKTRFLKAVKY